MYKHEDIVEDYLAVWNETDDVRRAEALGRSWAPDARYVDPMVVATGRQMIGDTIGAVQQQFPGWRFRLVGPVDGHHDQVRFQWALGPDDADAPVIGFDVAVLDDDGRIASVHGFLDTVPAA
jgi:hypothetical protein